MTDHFSDKQIEAFYARALEVSEMVVIAEHLASCDICHQKFHEVFQRERGSKPISISLSAEDWFRDEHLDYDQLVSLVEDKLDAEELEIVNIHLEVCESCREDVRSFIEFRQKYEQDLHIRYRADKNRYLKK